MWSDDTAADVRLTYREALEDGLDSDAATARVLDAHSAALTDEDDATVVWLALAAAQSNAGRLTDAVKSNALAVIDSGVDLRRWDGSETKTMAKRVQVLDKLRDQLTGEQPAVKRIRKRARPVTSLKPGDILAYRAASGRLHLLAVRAMKDTRYFVAPAIELLDFAGTQLPDISEIAQLKVRKAGRTARGPDQPAEPWWMVNSLALHRSGHDYREAGFELVAHLESAAIDTEHAMSSGTADYSNWVFWADYLTVQDEHLEKRLRSR